MNIRKFSPLLAQIKVVCHGRAAREGIRARESQRVDWIDINRRRTVEPTDSLLFKHVHLTEPDHEHIVWSPPVTHDVSMKVDICTVGGRRMDPSRKVAGERSGVEERQVRERKLG